MKTVLLTLAIVFSGLLMQAQTLTELANNTLVTRQDSKKVKSLIKTDYGYLTVTTYAYNNRITKLIVTIPNGTDAHTRIMDSHDYENKRVGRLHTDFYFLEYEWKAESYSSLEEARTAWYDYKNSKIREYQNVIVFKHYGKEKYVLALNTDDIINNSNYSEIQVD